uniref:Uncharacterized protein n=1 Tax=Lutzomyia longipalpis TaxID=7200 RepID=A0A7G3B6M5_LUTLO
MDGRTNGHFEANLLPRGHFPDVRKETPHKIPIRIMICLWRDGIVGCADNFVVLLGRIIVPIPHTVMLFEHRMMLCVIHIVLLLVHVVLMGICVVLLMFRVLLVVLCVFLMMFCVICVIGVLLVIYVVLLIRLISLTITYAVFPLHGITDNHLFLLLTAILEILNLNILPFLILKREFQHLWRPRGILSLQTSSGELSLFRTFSIWSGSDVRKEKGHFLLKVVGLNLCRGILLHALISQKTQPEIPPSCFTAINGYIGSLSYGFPGFS